MEDEGEGQLPQETTKLGNGVNGKERMKLGVKHLSKAREVKSAWLKC